MWVKYERVKELVLALKSHERSVHISDIGIDLFSISKSLK